MATDRVPPPEFGDLYIVEHLRRAGKSDSQAARELGVARETVYRWAREQHRLDPEKQARLAVVCGIEASEFNHHPDFPSLDAMVRNKPASVRRKATDILRALTEDT